MRISSRRSAALALVLGANLGSAINPMFEGARRDDPASYRLPLGNLDQPAGRRAAGGAVPAADRRACCSAWQPDLAKMTAAFHIAFNVGTAVVFIGLLDGMARLLKRLLPNRVQETDPSRPRYLDESALETPSLALADAARETLHMGDLVEIMLRKVMAAMMTNDRTLVDQVSQMDNSVDNLDEAIKLYVTKLTRGSLDEREGRRAMEIISFAINLEHIGDIIDKNLSELATKKIKRRFQFSTEGAEELSAFHKRTMDSLRIAFGVFMSGDVNEARKLLVEKAHLRNTETRRHRAASRSPARRPARDHRDHLAASRRAARPQADPLAHLFGGLSGARCRRRARRLSRHRSRSRRDPQWGRAFDAAIIGGPPALTATPARRRSGPRSPRRPSRATPDACGRDSPAGLRNCGSRSRRSARRARACRGSSPGTSSSPARAIRSRRPMKILSRPSASACSFTRPEPGTTIACDAGARPCGRSTTAAAARRSSMRPLVQEPMKTRSSVMSVIRSPAVRPI